MGICQQKSTCSALPRRDYPILCGCDSIGMINILYLDDGPFKPRIPKLENIQNYTKIEESKVKDMSDSPFHDEIALHL